MTEKELKPVIVSATSRVSEDGIDIECRFADGQKYAPVTVDEDHPEIAAAIIAALTRPAAEPVAFRFRKTGMYWNATCRVLEAEAAKENGCVVEPLYTTPPADDEAGRLLEWLDREGHDLRSKTSEFDASEFHYCVYEHYERRPDKLIGVGSDAIDALRSAYLAAREGKV